MGRGVGVGKTKGKFFFPFYFSLASSPSDSCLFDEDLLAVPLQGAVRGRCGDGGQATTSIGCRGSRALCVYLDRTSWTEAMVVSIKATRHTVPPGARRAVSLLPLLDSVESIEN